jgi:phospholipid/cholesterol/gamma-HCH transport system ATP-binding protein
VQVGTDLQEGGQEKVQNVPIVSLRNLEVRLGGQCIINDLSLTIQKGEFVGLIGPSGVGKSTLLKAMAGIIAATAGEIVLAEEPRLSLMFQEGALFDSFSVFDNVCFPLVKGKVPACLLKAEKREEVRGLVTRILDRVGLVWAANKMPNELSGGMRRRVSLARALVTSPHLAFLDDPTSGLDPVASSIIMDLILELQQEQGSTIVVASHDLRRLIPRSTRLVCLWSGEVAFDGNVESLFRENAATHNAEMDQVPHGQDFKVQKFVQCRYEW